MRGGRRDSGWREKEDSCSGSVENTEELETEPVCQEEEEEESLLFNLKG